MAWKKTSDPLFRGDSALGLSIPDPSANVSVVAHILYLGGAGRASQYHSTTEVQDVARHFATASGKVYQTTAPRAEAAGVAHVSQTELKNLLRGTGYGKAKAPSALQVMQARRYVEQWAEHLLDFGQLQSGTVAGVVNDVYKP